MPWDGTQHPSSEFGMVHDILAHNLGWYMIPQLEIWDSTDGMSHSMPVTRGIGGIEEGSQEQDDQ